MNISEYPYRTETHAHTKPSSKCADIEPEAVMEAYAAEGYHSVVIGNHFNQKYLDFYGDKEKAVSSYLEDYERAKKAGEALGIHAILGCELRFTEDDNDYLLFGIDPSDIYEAYDFFEQGVSAFSAFFRKEGHLFVQAHPFRSVCTPVSPSLIDGVEAFNMHVSFNAGIALGTKYAKAHDLLITAGSDFHDLSCLGCSAIRTKTVMKNSHDLASVLKSRDYLIEIGGSLVLPYGNF